MRDQLWFHACLFIREDSSILKQEHNDSQSSDFRFIRSKLVIAMIHHSFITIFESVFTANVILTT